MDERLEKLKNYFIEQLGLQNYRLETYSFHKETMFNGEVHSKCNLEFFPNATKNEAEEDRNPPGTAIIDYNLTTNSIMNIVFVDEQSFSTQTPFPNQTVEEIAAWIENVTLYRFNQDFIVADTLDNGYQFKTEINGLPTSPSGLIEVEFDHSGKLVSFIMFDMPQIDREIEKENFSLTIDKIESIVQEQIQLLQFPNENEQKFMSIYAMNEVFVTNKDFHLIPFFTHERNAVFIHKIIEWDRPLEGRIVKKFLEPTSAISLQEAFAHNSLIQRKTITDEQLARLIPKVRDVLRTIRPNDSGKWELTKVAREEHFIEVICKWIEQKDVFFNRKFIVLFDPKTMEVLNYMDNGALHEAFDSFTPAAKAKVSLEAAYKKLFDKVTIEPYYVYDVKTNQYLLCGLLDCAFCVDAVTGKVMPLDEI